MGSPSSPCSTQQREAFQAAGLDEGFRLAPHQDAAALVGLQAALTQTWRSSGEGRRNHGICRRPIDLIGKKKLTLSIPTQCNFIQLRTNLLAGNPSPCIPPPKTLRKPSRRRRQRARAARADRNRTIRGAKARGIPELNHWSSVLRQAALLDLARCGQCGACADGTQASEAEPTYHVGRGVVGGFGKSKKDNTSERKERQGNAREVTTGLTFLRLYS